MSEQRRFLEPHWTLQQRALLLGWAVVILLGAGLWWGSDHDAAAGQDVAPGAPPAAKDPPASDDADGPRVEAPQRSRVTNPRAATVRAPGAAEAAAWPEEELPSFFEVGALLRSSLDEVIERLDFSPRERYLLGTPAGKRIAAEELRLTRQRMDDLCDADGTMATNLARRLAAAGFRGTEPPPPGHESEYSEVWSSKGTFYLSNEEYPELPALKKCIRRLPSELRSAIVRRLEAIPFEKR